METGQRPLGLTAVPLIGRVLEAVIVRFVPAPARPAIFGEDTRNRAVLRVLMVPVLFTADPHRIKDRAGRHLTKPRHVKGLAP